MKKGIKIEYIEPDKLNPYENNPRNNEKAVDLVVKSIEDYGFNVPILIDKIGGGGRRTYAPHRGPQNWHGKGAVHCA